MSASLTGVGMPQTLRARHLDREARSYLRFHNLLARRPVSSYPIGEMRELWRLLALALGRRVPVASAVEHRIDGPAGPIDLRIYRPRKQPGLAPGLLWCHGGGFVAGGLDTGDSICRNLARAAGAIVVSVRIRLAPEHDLYAGREDFLAALDWVAKEGASVGVDGSLLAVGGDSAGGNIAAAAAQECTRRGGPPLRLQVLAYPATNLRDHHPSKNENAKGYFLTAEFVDWVTPLIAGSLDLADPRLSPAFSPDLRGLPPALIVSAGFDPIRDDGLHYAARLRAAGIPVELLHYAGQFHGFLNFDALVGAARDALKRIGQSLAGAFRRDACADRTIEIADRRSRVRVLDASVELAIATLVVGRSMQQWSGLLLRLLAPRAASALRLVLRPWSRPVACVQRGVTSQLARPAVRQTYPVAITHRTKQELGALS